MVVDGESKFAEIGARRIEERLTKTLERSKSVLLPAIGAWGFGHSLVIGHWSFEFDTPPYGTR